MAETPNSKTFTLGDLLNNKIDNVDDVIEPTKHEETQILEDPNMCVECEDQFFSLFCEQCQDNFCKPCFEFVHKKGNRKKHSTKDFSVDHKKDEKEVIEEKVCDEKTHTKEDGRLDLFLSFSSDTFIERSKYTPIRPTLKQRKLLRLVDATMEISEYTDKIDIISNKSKNQRILSQIKEICAILTGLVVAVDYNEGKKLLQKSNFSEYENFFRNAFELARSHKIRNPDKMRTSYGKLIHFLQDSADPTIIKLLNFENVKKVNTVHSILAEKNSLDCLKDISLLLKVFKNIETKGRSRREINRQIKQKEENFEKFCNKHSAGVEVCKEDLRILVRSLGDNLTFLQFNRIPIDKMLRLLKRHFDPEKGVENERFSLAINYGKKGARLSHNHRTQYCYVQQTLTLWREIIDNFFKLWMLAEEDLLDPNNYYRLVDTGQGLHRIQGCKRVEQEMRKILNRVQFKTKNWIGSSVIHLGDHNVPNAFIFIDKYTQIPRILNPIILTLERIPEIMEDSSLAKYVISEFGSEINLKLEILADFFRHGFDGSGADNFYDAGSCIDGRLTSAWNWCSHLMKKKFATVFMFSGFSSFDGEWS